MAGVAQAGIKGLKIRYQFLEDGTPFDLTLASLIKLHIKPPQGPLMTRIATKEPGALGWAYWETPDRTSITEQGQWRVQGEVTLGDYEGPAGIDTFEVQGNLF